jgi:hypothetical protein
MALFRSMLGKRAFGFGSNAWKACLTDSRYSSRRRHERGEYCAVMKPLPTEVPRDDIFVETAEEVDKVGEIHLACAPITNQIRVDSARLNGAAHFISPIGRASVSLKEIQKSCCLVIEGMQGRFIR